MRTVGPVSHAASALLTVRHDAAQLCVLSTQRLQLRRQGGHVARRAARAGAAISAHAAKAGLVHDSRLLVEMTTRRRERSQLAARYCGRVAYGVGGGANGTATSRVA
jgi:hypothetical protein